MEPWAARLDRGDHESAWDEFVHRYRRLILATIRHFVEDHDEVMDVFAHVCEALHQDQMARVRKFFNGKPHQATFSTWLVAVVRNSTIDFFRHRDGRKRLSAAAQQLDPLHKSIYELVFLRGVSHREAFEILCGKDGFDSSFPDFLKEVRTTYRAVSGGKKNRLMRELGGGIRLEVEDESHDPVELADVRHRLAEVLRSLKKEDRLTVQLFVVDGLQAEQVARIVGFSSPKTVYNRAYRALRLMRKELEQQGIAGP